MRKESAQAKGIQMKQEFVFQDYQGWIHGAVQTRTPQQNGKINAANRKDRVQGTWLPKSSLTEKELSKRAPGWDDFFVNEGEPK
jgi:hypothetical protein